MRTNKVAAVGIAVSLVVGSTGLPALAQSADAAPDGSYQIAQQSYADVIVALENTGYRVVDMRSTFLGRLRIRAQNREHMREVIVSRSTGEIMSDQIIKVFATRGDGSPAATRQTAAVSKGGDTSGDSSAGTSSVSASVGGSSGVSASVGKTSVSIGGGGISIGN
jgi:nucleoside diphosphate kinase